MNSLWKNKWHSVTNLVYFHSLPRTVCVDRASEEECSQWEREGRCVKDKLAMDRICRATCSKCIHRCQNQVPLAQCERFRRRGACKDRLYQMLCRRTCMPQECSKSLTIFDHSRNSFALPMWIQSSRIKNEKSLYHLLSNDY